MQCSYIFAVYQINGDFNAFDNINPYSRKYKEKKNKYTEKGNSNMYSAKTIAEYIIWRLRKGDLGDDSVTNIRLQQILYFLQAAFLVSKEEPLFQEDILACTFGTVVSEVYAKYKVYGNIRIFSEPDRPFIATDDAELIDEMLKKISNYSEKYIKKVIKSQKTWKGNYEENKKNIIPISDIFNFFKEKEI